MENSGLNTTAVFTAHRCKTPVYALILIALPWLIAAFVFVFRANINSVCEDLGYILFTVFLFLPILLAFLFSRHYNLFSREDLTLTIDSDGLKVTEGEKTVAYQWTQIKQLFFCSQMTPAGYFRFMKIVTIKQIYDKRRNQTRNYYPAFDYFFYGFDKTEKEILDAYSSFKR